MLVAARPVFFELGLETASLHGITGCAGHTPGAIDSEFNSNDEACSDTMLLRDSSSAQIRGTKR